jgi:hypothetical protein
MPSADIQTFGLVLGLIVCSKLSENLGGKLLVRGSSYNIDDARPNSNDHLTSQPWNSLSKNKHIAVDIYFSDYHHETSNVTASFDPPGIISLLCNPSPIFHPPELAAYHFINFFISKPWAIQKNDLHHSN